MNRFLVLLLGVFPLLVCKKHIEEHTKIDSTSVTEHVTSAGEHVVTSTTTGPSETTVDEFVYDKPEPQPDGGVPNRGPLKQHTHTNTKTGSATKLEDLYKEQEDYGLNLDKKFVESTKESDTQFMGCSLGTTVWGIIILIGIVTLGYFILKARKVL